MTRCRCPACGYVQSWGAGRGCRIKSVPCALCGHRGLKGYRPRQHEYTGRECAIEGCGHGEPECRVVEVTHPFQTAVSVRVREGWWGARQSGPYRGGTFVCDHHRLSSVPWEEHETSDVGPSRAAPPR